MANAMIINDRNEVLQRIQCLSESDDCSYVKSINISNQYIDYELLPHIDEILSKCINVNDLTFNNCHFDNLLGIDSIDFSFLGNLSLRKIAIINCEIDDKAMGEILRNLNGYTVREIDFSNNKLGADKELFDKLMSGYFNGGKFAIKAPNLSGNPALTNNLETITDLDESTNNSARSSQNKESF